MTAVPHRRTSAHGWVRRTMAAQRARVAPQDDAMTPLTKKLARTPVGGFPLRAVMATATPSELTSPSTIMAAKAAAHTFG